MSRYLDLLDEIPAAIIEPDPPSTDPAGETLPNGWKIFPGSKHPHEYWIARFNEIEAAIRRAYGEPEGR